MPSDDLKKRIEALNRKPLKNVPESGSSEAPEIRGLRRKLEKQKSKPAPSSSPASAPVRPSAPSSVDSRDLPGPIIYSRGVPVNGRAPGISPSAVGRDFGPPVKLEDAVQGVPAQALLGPGYYLVEQHARELEAEADHLHRRFVSLTGHPQGQAVERLCRICNSDRVCPSGVLFLDLETTGLSMTPLFLVGTMECCDDGFRFRQYFARDYSEEISVLSAIDERMRDVDVLVTFNGKTFDVPFMRNRAIATGVKLHLPAVHLDLLHEARRIYRRELPNCKLQTLEQMVCGRSRDDDIPGSEIPGVYHEYVRTGNANKISLVLMHNLYDLLTMADLMARMWGRE